MRQLAAILFADMAGYTALMQENETHARQKRQRLKEVLEQNIPRYNGKIHQYYGDGSLSIFTSAIDGIQCAIEMQQQWRQHEPKVEVRIGLHTGDVLLEEESIYGDGVNLASRIESLAVPGSIFISEKAADEVKNQQGILLQEMGYFELKNIRQPVRIFAVANPGLAVPLPQELEGKTVAPQNRLAVLPFVNMSADPENEYFSDGVTEELLNALTRVEGLQVTSRTSAFAFKGRNDDVREIARRLNVDKVLEGSVRRSGNRVRITAQLVNAADGYHLWSETYDRNLVDIFEVQDEISGIIANRLRENLSAAKRKEPLVKAPTKNLEAYTWYLKGLHFWYKLSPASTRKAIDCFEKAATLAPDYAQAYALMASAYSHLGATGQLTPVKAFERVKQYCQKALALDKDIAEGYVALAALYLFYEWQWDKGYEALQTGLRLNPNLMGIYQLLGFYYGIIGRNQDAIRILEEGALRDPLSPIIIQFLGDAYLAADRYDEALLQAEKLLDIDPQMRIALELKGWCMGMKGNWETALQLFQELHRLTGHPLKGITPMGYALAKLGQRDEAIRCIEKIKQRQEMEPETVMDADQAIIWWALGDKEKALGLLEQSIAKRMISLVFYLQHPFMSGIEAEPRYRKLRENAGLPQIDSTEAAATA